MTTFQTIILVYLAFFIVNVIAAVLMTKYDLDHGLDFTLGDIFSALGFSLIPMFNLLLWLNYYKNITISDIVIFKGKKVDSNQPTS